MLKDEVLYAGQTFEKGWHVVRGHWFSFQGLARDSTGDRRYLQLKDDALFNVNSMIRVKGVQFTSTFRRARKQGGAAAVLSREWMMNAEVHQRVLESA